FGFWLEADPLVLWRRVSERKGGPSDATVDILSRQLQRKAGQASWRRTDSDRKPVDIAAELRRCWQRDASETLCTAS
ncbi:aminoglycoside phosphotransferase, partial [Mesorhizobium sp. M2D.F.Ca.ET.145.01.1.1]